MLCIWCVAAALLAMAGTTRILVKWEERAVATAPYPPLWPFRGTYSIRA